MSTYLPRNAEATVSRALAGSPVAAILGPRQCGKSTLARHVMEGRDSVYLDLERPTHANRLRDPEAYLSRMAGKLVCLDEVHRVPELFPILKSIVDDWGGNGHFLVLGSAGPSLLRQGSETLAGRIRFVPLTPFQLREVDDPAGPTKLWLRGGLPRSYLAPEDSESRAWREDFIQTFLERDIPQLGFRIPAATLRRFWQMCAHVHGQVLNLSQIGDALGVSHHTVRSYLDILEQTFLVRVLPPLVANVRKRLVKSPKLLLRDSGILHALLGIETFDDLMGHPTYGHSWEGFVIENVLSAAEGWKASYYRSASGDEIDLVLERGVERLAVECKASSTPELAPGFHRALRDLKLKESWVVAPVAESYPLGDGVTVAPVMALVNRMGHRRT